MYNRIVNLLFDYLEVKFIKSKILIACMLLVMLVSLTAVVASDVDDTSLSSNNDTLTVQNIAGDSAVLKQSDNDDTNIESSSESDYGGDLLASSSDENVLAAGNRQNLLDAINGGENVILNDSYVVTGTTITVNSNKVIDGRGNTITGSGTRLFTISGTPSITLKNIKFVRCTNSNGGVVYSTSGVNLTIINCTFESCGRPIYLSSVNANLNVVNCTFNSITNNGAIYSQCRQLELKSFS